MNADTKRLFVITFEKQTDEGDWIADYMVLEDVSEAFGMMRYLQNEGMRCVRVREFERI